MITRWNDAAVPWVVSANWLDSINGRVSERLASGYIRFCSYPCLTPVYHLVCFWLQGSCSTVVRRIITPLGHELVAYDRRNHSPHSLPALYHVYRAVIEHTFQMVTKECKEYNRRCSKQSSGSFLSADLRTTWQQPPLLNLDLGYEVSITPTLALRLLGISTTQ
jgi:hypothetical protein